MRGTACYQNIGWSAVRIKIFSTHSTCIACLLPAGRTVSGSTRKALLQLDNANQKASVFMNGYGGLIEKTLIATMPPTKNR